MDELSIYQKQEIERAIARNESRVRRERYRSAPDDERSMKLDEVRKVAIEVKRRPSGGGYIRDGVWVASGKSKVEEALIIAVDYLQEEAAERRLWWTAVWVLLFGCGGAYLLTLVIFGYLLAGG